MTRAGHESADGVRRSGSLPGRPGRAERCESRVGDRASATLPPLEDGVVPRARALVRAAAALRGWLLAPTAEADEMQQAVDPVVTALTGVPARA
ncbi:hypothetical protein AQJ91_34745 [Streptomyces dysideae]|uniref:Uncharacterized protein n=1 Tax=Streptomyces dysideae TaxID=909626 RepID=A0A101UTP5_9ACTN|nr:hypothetical protein AQJ91_34745 [Streptomyces dysideae]